MENALVTKIPLKRRIQDTPTKLTWSIATNQVLHGSSRPIRLVKKRISTLKKIIILASLVMSTSACATLTNDENVPIAMSFSDGSQGNCSLVNKRGNWEVDMPDTVSVRRSDDRLQYSCVTTSGKTGKGGIESTMGGKIIASAVFLDFGIVDAITDKHREYPASFVVPVR